MAAQLEEERAALLGKKRREQVRKQVLLGPSAAFSVQESQDVCLVAIDQFTAFKNCTFACA